jgi:hypothetical protein
LPDLYNIMSEKRYQVFVSSTYEDLQAERQEVMHALLELECIPSGMEMFPAATEDQWTLIKDVIADCDYYVVILGGRYGSVGDTGVSYTEMEYRHAVSLNKPVIAFLHKSPDSLPKNRTEPLEAGQNKLREFRTLCEKRVCKYWSGAGELGSVVSRGLIMLQRKHPGIGWIRGDAQTSEAASKKILELKEEIDRLKKDLEKSTTQAPPGSETLSQGEDEETFTVKFSAFKGPLEYTCHIAINVCWDDIFNEISPVMIHEASEPTLRSVLDKYFGEIARAQAPKSKNFEGMTSMRAFALDNDAFQTIKIQFRSLGMITKSTRSRSVKDTGTYWTLTPYGDNVMVRLRAIKKVAEDEI